MRTDRDPAVDVTRIEKGVSVCGVGRVGEPFDPSGSIGPSNDMTPDPATTATPKATA
jgi:hypothetical protein